MKIKAASGIMLTLILISMLTLAFNIQLVRPDPSEPPVTEWDKTYGGAGDDFALSVEQTDDGGYIAAGATDSFGAGIVDFWVVKTDASGNLQWNKTYGGAVGEEALSVQQTSDGGYIVAGETYSFGVGRYDFWLVKTDANGNMEWNKTYGGVDYDGAWSVQQTSDGGYIAAGYTNSFGAGAYDFWVVKTDASGTMEWNKTYGGASTDWGHSVEQTSDEGYIVAGYTCSFGLAGVHFWLVKTDAAGNMEWNKTYGAGGEVAYSVQQTSDEGYIAAGVTGSFGGAWLVKTDAYGNMEWNETYSGGGADFVQQTSDGGYIFAGGWLAKTDANGSLVWSNDYGGYARCVRQTFNGGYIVAGYSAGNAWLIKLGPEPRTWTVDDDGVECPDADFTSIQEAINAASDGDTIYVYNGTYYENVVVNKTVSLVGENKATTIIDGWGTGGTLVNVTASKVTFSGFTIQHSGLWYNDWGIILFHSNGSHIIENIVTNNFNGICLWSSYDNNITDNVITNNYYFGVYLANSGYNNLSGNIISNNTHGASFAVSGSNILRKNHMLDNPYNFGVNGINLSDFIQDIDTSNTVEGKPIYYLINRHDEQIPADAGYVALVNSTNMTVRNLALTNNDNGVLFANTNSSIIENVTVTSNYGGIELWKSNGNTVRNSTASNNQWGIRMEMSNNTSVSCNLISSNNQMGIGLGSGSAGNVISENTISNNFGAGISIQESEENIFYHNNFFNDHVTVTAGYTNTWDDGYPSGGNYWSDYEERYPDAEELDGSGIWDTPYVIDGNNQDNYPLMNPWTPTPQVVTATVDIAPDTINLKSKGKWITAYIELSENHNVSNINRTTVLLNHTIPVDSFWIDKPLESVIGDYDNDGITDLMVKFDRQALIEYLKTKGTTDAEVTIAITGEQILLVLLFMVKKEVFELNRFKLVHYPVCTHSTNYNLNRHANSQHI